MSTDAPDRADGPPRTRAEARALREAAAREAAEREDLQREQDLQREGVRGEASGPPASTDGAPPDETERVETPNDRPERAADAPHRRFRLTLVAVVAILALAGVGLGMVSLFQGPRVTTVQVDPQQAIEYSGSRVIFTVNQPLAEIDPAQVTVQPEVPFTVDASGRSVGVRFSTPLDDETEYTVRVADVTTVGGGPAATLETSFTTPASQVYLLQRAVEGDDTIFLSDLTGQAAPVFTHPRINDFRATADRLVVAVEDDEGNSQILAMNPDGTDPRALPLPGVGFVGGLQVSERGGLVGYTFSDRELTATSGRASVLVTQRIEGDGEPSLVEVGDQIVSVADWRFVPDTSSVLFIDFAGGLYVEDRAGAAGPDPLGSALSIEGVARGDYTAVIQRLTDAGGRESVVLDLAGGGEEPLPRSTPDYGPPTELTPIPGGTLQRIIQRDSAGIPTGQAIIRVAEDGTAEPLLEVSGADTIVQFCASPSGQYASIVIAPDLPNNPYDDRLTPLPQRMEMHIIEVDTGDQLVVISGFDISWCGYAPKL